jgi:Domain of Unknown Function with PDB structure (DUF3857)
MRRFSLLSLGLLTCIATHAPILRAQFQPPSEEELKMTADPKAPGADAVFLEIKETSNDSTRRKTYYARIKVLTEAGRDLATVEIPYLKGTDEVTQVKGRTIHPDGTVAPLAVKPENLLGVKTKEEQTDRAVFTLPNVEVGSILEYTYELSYFDFALAAPRWTIQQPYFVHQAHYEFLKTNPYSSMIWWSRLPPGVEVKNSPVGYSIDVTDVPPIPKEEWMPPISSFFYMAIFYYTDGEDADHYWQDEAKSWSRDVDDFAEPSRALRDAVRGLTVPEDTELVKAKKLYIAVHTLDNTDFSREKGESERKQLKIKEVKRAADIWGQRTGSREGIALLYLAMLRAAGLTAYAAKVVDRDEGVFDPAYMSLDQLNATVVGLEVGGQTIFLDPGEKMCPFGTMNWRHSLAAGIEQRTTGMAYTTMPQQQYKENVTMRSGDLTLDSHGGVTGRIVIAMTGQEALHWRQLALETDAGEVKKQFDSELEDLMPQGVEAHVDHILGMDDPYANLTAMVNVEGILGSATPKHLIVPGFLFETRGHVPFVNEEKRKTPVDMHYGEIVTDQITYHLAPGMSVEGLPADEKNLWNDHAIYYAQVRSTSGRVQATRSLARAFTFAKPFEYQDLRTFYLKVAEADQEQLVLSPQPDQGSQ